MTRQDYVCSFEKLNMTNKVNKKPECFSERLALVLLAVQILKLFLVIQIIQIIILAYNFTTNCGRGTEYFYKLGSQISPLFHAMHLLKLKELCSPKVVF